MRKLVVILLLTATTADARPSLPTKATSLLPVAVNSPKVIDKLPVLSKSYVAHRDIVGRLLDRRAPDITVKLLSTAVLTSGVGLLITGVATLDFFPAVSSLFIIPHGIIGVSLSLPRGAPFSETFEKQRELRRAKLDRRLNHYLGKEVYYLHDGDGIELPAVVYGTVKGAVSDDKLMIKIGELDDRASSEITPTLEAYEEVEIARIGSILVPDHEDVGRYVQLLSDADKPEYPYIIARINKVYTDDRLEVVAEYGIDYENKRHPLSHYTLFLHRSQLPKEDVTYFSK